ncbi:MAG: aminopeptidase [Thermoplasmata archaeon]
MRARTEQTLARTVLAAYLGVRPRETVSIEAWSHALPWARAFVVEARRMGAEPLLVIEDEDAFFRTMAALPRTALPVAPGALATLSDVHVYLGGPEAFPRLGGVRPEELRSIVDRHDAVWRGAARRARTRFARLAIAAATPVAAERYRVDLDSWREELVAASTVAPPRLALIGRAAARRLARARHIRIRHSNGTDVTTELLPGRRRVEDGSSARRPPSFATDIPTGRIVVVPKPRSTEGLWESNRPLYDRYSETPVQLAAQFRFAGGRLREFSFDRGGEAFACAYEAGGRGRDSLGAIAFGLNSRIRRAPEVGDLAEGAVSLRLGGEAAAGGRRRAIFSRVVTLTGADVELDGRPWLSGGRATN